jgi:GMP synthase-like glutamine amidotransferase
MIAKQPAAAPRRVAVIRDYVLTQATWGREMLDSIGELVSKLSDDDQKVMVDHFQPIEDGVLPADASTYDLIVLTGGVYDLTRLNATPEHDPWVANLLDFIRNAVATSPSTKLLGICWGHQAISYALGGKIAYREGGPLVRLTCRHRRGPHRVDHVQRQGRDFTDVYRSTLPTSH